jgi:hypothetical protein
MRARNVMWLSEQVSESVSVFKEASKIFHLNFSLELSRLKIKKLYANVQKVLI